MRVGAGAALLGLMAVACGGTNGAGGGATGGNRGGGGMGGVAGAGSGAVGGGRAGAAGTGASGGGTSAGGGSGIGGADGGTCEQVEPCGGDLEGTWIAQGGCIDDTYMLGSLGFQPGGCPVNLHGHAMATATGSVTYDGATGTFTIDVTETLTASFDFPASCLVANQTCATKFAAYGQTSPGAGCTGTTTCDCTFIEPTTWSGSGTYTVNATDVWMDDTRTGTDDRTYCIQNGTMHFPDVDTNSNAGPMGAHPVERDTFFIKQ